MCLLNNHIHSGEIALSHYVSDHIPGIYPQSYVREVTLGRFFMQGCAQNPDFGQTRAIEQ